MCMEKCIESNCEVVYNYVSSHTLKVKGIYTIISLDNSPQFPNSLLQTSSLIVPMNFPIDYYEISIH